MSNAGHNRLEALAGDIRQAHAESRASAEKAIVAGQLLVEAKGIVRHGQWSTWLDKNVGFSERTARRYMQLAQAGLSSADVAPFGIRAAVEHLATRQRGPDYDKPADRKRLAALMRARANRAIYVIRSEPGPVKIGIAGCPFSRLNSLRGGSPVPLYLDYAAEVDGSHRALERRAHEILAENRVTGEWFNVETQKALAAVLRAANELGVALVPVPSRPS
jgi:hypothetical protein